MNRPMFALALLLAATAPRAEEKAAQPVRFQLAAAKVHEECLRMEAGDKRDYRWKSNAAVDFNIHYHKGNDVFYPVKVDATRAHRGTFTAKTGEDYCWMWTARAAPAAVESEIGKR